ncbi:MAG: hypothetical protein WB777_26565, partial [Mycobacterium sp.]
PIVGRVPDSLHRAPNPKVELGGRRYRPNLPSRVTLRARVFRELRGGFDPEARGGELADVLADLSLG